MDVPWKTQACRPTVTSAVSVTLCAMNVPAPTTTFGPSEAERWTTGMNTPPRASSVSAHRRRAAMFPSAVTNTSSGCGTYVEGSPITGG